MATTALGCSPAHQAAKLAGELAAHSAALDWLQALGLPVPAASDPTELWRDCQLLGRVADAVQAARLGAGPPQVPQGGASGGRPRRYRDILNDFASWQQLCRELGVGSGLLPSLADLEQGHGGPAVCACLQAVADECAAAGLLVPRWGGADARSGLRGSMPRQASAKRAEMFLSTGASPLKLPAMDKCLTPRAFAGKAGSPGVAALRDSNSNLRGWLHSGGQSGQKASPQVQQQPEVAVGQEQEAQRGYLGSTVAALERAAMEAAEAARRPQAVPHQQQQPRRPSLPRLDVAAVAAAAAAEAAEEAGGSCLPSPLSSPASSMGSPHADAYCSSTTCTSAASSPGVGSPSRYRLTPTRLQQHAHANPLWAHSPQASAPGGGSSRVGQVAETAAAPSPQPRAGEQRRHQEEEQAEERLRGSYGGGNDLLESLLCPPHLKPAHTQLLGALMHTHTGPTAQQRAAGEAAVAEAQRADATAAALELQQEQEQEHSPQPAAVRALAAPGSDSQMHGQRQGGGGARRFALMLLGAAAGAAALAAGLAQQGGRPSSRPSRPQPVPSQQRASSRTVRESSRERREAGRGNGGASSKAAAPWEHAITHG